MRTFFAHGRHFQSLRQLYTFCESDCDVSNRLISMKASHFQITSFVLGSSCFELSLQAFCCGGKCPLKEIYIGYLLFGQIISFTRISIYVEQTRFLQRSANSFFRLITQTVNGGTQANSSYILNSWQQI